REEDRRFHELVNARNHADTLVHATTKSLHDLGDKVSAEEKQEIEAALDEVKQALKGDDKEAIEAKVQRLSGLAGKLAERAYKEAGAEPQQPPPASETPGGNGAARADNVVDADFEEVKEDRK
ncbi:MAG: Hsp70 family protein, partial [Gammaproteobacteria bacterium]